MYYMIRKVDFTLPGLPQTNVLYATKEAMTTMRLLPIFVFYKQSKTDPENWENMQSSEF